MLKNIKRAFYLHTNHCLLCYFFSSSFSAHSPDNLFLGFVVDKAAKEDAEGMPDEEAKSNKPIGVLYAKDAMYLQVS